MRDYGHINQQNLLRERLKQAQEKARRTGNRADEEAASLIMEFFT